MTVRMRTRAMAGITVALLAGLVLALAPSGSQAVGTATTPIKSPNDGPVLTSAQGLGKPNCGAYIKRKPDGTPWKCYWSDDFSGTRLNSSKWRLITSWDASFGERNDCHVNSRYNVQVASGTLRMTTRRNLVPFTCGKGDKAYRATATSPIVSTFGKFYQNRGRFEFRARWLFTGRKGLQKAMWLYPDTAGLGPVVSGEIDVAEWYSSVPRRVIPYLHYTTGILGGLLGSKEVTNVNCFVDRIDRFHTYTLDWTPNQLTIAYDGKVCLKNTSGVILGQFTRPYFINMMMAQGVGRNAPDANTPLRATAEVDYVRVWR